MLTFSQKKKKNANAKINKYSDDIAKICFFILRMVYNQTFQPATSYRSLVKWFLARKSHA